MTINGLQFINYLLDTGDYDCIINNKITGDWFVEDEKGQFEYIINYYNTYNSFPTKLTFMGVFPEFENMEPPKVITPIIDSLRNDRNIRVMAKTHNELRDILTNNPDPDKVTHLLRDISQRYAELSIDSSTSDFINAKQFTNDALSHFDDASSNIGKYFYPTGDLWLDSVFDGGWDKNGDYVIVSGRPGTGKSMLLCAFAAEQYRIGKRVVFYEGEMTAIRTFERIMSHRSNIPTYDLKRGTKEKREEYKEALEKFKQCLGELFIVTPADLGNQYATANQLEAICKKVNADILFIDQQSLMRDMDNRKKASFEIAASISRQIKALRDKLNIPVITAVQQNRPKPDLNGVNTANLAGSDVIGQDATRVLFVEETSNVAKEDNGDRDNETKKIMITVAKNRDGVKGIYKIYNANFNICRFEPTDGTSISREDVTEFDNETDPF